jgi:hypothetical protein
LKLFLFLFQFQQSSLVFWPIMFAHSTWMGVFSMNFVELLMTNEIFFVCWWENVEMTPPHVSFSRLVVSRINFLRQTTDKRNSKWKSLM